MSVEEAIAGIRDETVYAAVVRNGHGATILATSAGRTPEEALLYAGSTHMEVVGVVQLHPCQFWPVSQIVDNSH